MASFIRPENPSAEWMRPDQLADDAFTYEAGKILLGKAKERMIGIDDNRHVMTIAGSRAGKSATSLMPNLLTWPGSVIVIDPKGELATETASHREKMGQDVFIFDPFNVVKDGATPSHKSFNPLDELRLASPDDVIDQASTLAEAMVIAEGADGGRSDHWAMSAKNLIRGLILYAMHKQPLRASLSDVRGFLTLPYDDGEDDAPAAPGTLEWVFEDMLEAEDAFGGVLAGVGGTMLGKADTERANIMSTAIEQTAFLDSPPMNRHLAQAGIGSMRCLKEKPTTIYLVLPASRLATHFRWLRMILTLAMDAMESTENKTDKPVLFILEEFPSLGYVRQLEAAAGLMAGYGVKLWSVIQDLSQLKAHYPKSWETFIGNAGVVEAFGNTDSTTLEYLSKRLGTTLAIQAQPTDRPTLGAQRGGDTLPEKDQIISIPLMAPWEIALAFARDQNNKLIMIAGRKPIALRRIFWREMINGA